VLSPYLKFGCLSARLFHAQLLSIYKQEKAHTKPPVSLRGQLLWREFFYTVSTQVANFDKMEVGRDLAVAGVHIPAAVPGDVRRWREDKI
jgi:deoxyribodipyrimidine photolyase